MKLPIVDKCSCGCTLKTGCIIIGSIMLAASIIGLISASTQAQELKRAWNDYKNIKELVQMWPDDGWVSRTLTGTQAQQLKHAWNDNKNIKERVMWPDDGRVSTTLTVFRGIMTTYAVLWAMEIVLNICLLYGTIKCKVRLIFTWVASHAVLLVVFVLLTLVTAIMYFVNYNIIGGIIMLIAMSINAVVTMYFIIVVNSHYHEVKVATSDPAIDIK